MSISTFASTFHGVSFFSSAMFASEFHLQEQTIGRQASFLGLRDINRLAVF